MTWHQESAPTRAPRFNLRELRKFESCVDDIMDDIEKFFDQSLHRRQKKHAHKHDATTPLAPFSSTLHDMVSTPSATTTTTPIWQDKDLICDNCQGQDHDPRECPNLLCPLCNVKGHMMWECQFGDQDDEKMVEHGIFPLTMEASMDDAISLVDSPSEDAEHGIFPLAVELSDDA